MVGYQLGLDSNPYHARFFPFELFYFLAGILTYRLYASQETRVAILLRGGVGLGVGVLYLAGIVFFYDLVKLLPAPALYGGFEDYLHSVALCVLTVPALVALFSFTRTNRIDRQLGELSYPIYVIHYGFVSVLIHTKVILPFNISSYWAVVILTLLLAVMMHVFIQIPVDRWRARQFVSH